MAKVQLSNRELSAFCEQVAMLLKSGISIEEGFAMMLADSEIKDERAILQAILDGYSKGGQLSAALSESGAFPKYMLDMAEIGEVSGHLDNVMHALSEYYTREQQIQDNLRGAVRYPAIMIVMMLAVVVVLIVKVVPIFGVVFRQLGSEMSGISAGIMSLGTAMSKYSLVIAALVGAVLCFLIYCSKTTSGKKLGKEILEKMWITKGIYAKIADARFSSGLSLMLSSGIESEKSLEMVKKLVDNAKSVSKIEECQRKMEEGESLETALVQTGLFSGLHGRMVTIGFKTGNADEVMRTVSNNLSDEVDTHINNTISIIEPSLVAIFSVVVGMILLSVMLPLVGIMSSIG